MKFIAVLAVLLPLSVQAIVSGQVIYNGTFRQSVALAFKTSQETLSEVYCSGTLIGPRVIITAAHCLSSGAKAFKLTREQFVQKTWIYVGDSSAQKQLPYVDAQFQVQSAVIHPANDSVYSDLALLVLKQDIDIHTLQISPAPLTLATKSMIGRELTHVGFGMVQNNGVKGTKAFFALPLKGLNGYNGLEVGQMRTPGPSACNGDSGGSAYLHDVDGQLKFIGVENSISNRPCGEAATYFIPITPQILGWIRSVRLPLFE